MTKAALALGAVLFAVGLLVGFAMGSMVASPPPVVTRAAESATATPPSAPVAPSASGPERRVSRDRDASQEAAALASIETDVPPPASGDGTITGTVLTADGSPLDRVLVRATPRFQDDDDEEEPQGPPGAAPPRADVERQVRLLVQRLRRMEAATHEATTDSAGAYVLAGLGEVAYEVGAWRVGYEIERAAGETWESVPTGRRCDFRATPVDAVTVSVLLPDGLVADEAVITWTPTAGGDVATRSWRRNSPDVVMEAGTYEVTATVLPDGSPWYRLAGLRLARRGWSAAAPEPLYASDPQTITVGAGGPQTLTFQLRGRPALLVHVDYASLERPTAVRIAAVRLDGNTRADPALLLDEGVTHADWLEDAQDGALSGLEPGTYLVGATLRGGRVACSTTVTIAGEPVPVRLEIPAGSERDWVKVWVRAPDGTPVHDIELECGCRGSAGSGHAEVSASPQADGSYRVPHYERDGPSLGSSSGFGGSELGGGKRRYFVRATSKRYGTAEATYDPATDAETTIQLIEPALLRVTISGYAGIPDEGGANVYLEPAGESYDATRPRRTEGEIDAKGVVRFPPVVPGSYEVVLRLAAPATGHERTFRGWGGTEVARVPVTLQPGEAAVTVAVPPLADLVVTFRHDAPSLERLRPDGTLHDVGAAASQEGLQVTFHHLEAGRYRLVDPDGDMWVEVPATSRVAFAPRPFNAYHVEIGGNGYLHELGLRSGDLVVAIDGVELTNRLTMDAAMAAAKTRDTARFTVERAGRRFDVTADVERFEDDPESVYRRWSR